MHMYTRGNKKIIKKCRFDFSIITSFIEEPINVTGDMLTDIGFKFSLTIGQNCSKHTYVKNIRNHWSISIILFQKNTCVFFVFFLFPLVYIVIKYYNQSPVTLAYVFLGKATASICWNVWLVCYFSKLNVEINRQIYAGNALVMSKYIVFFFFFFCFFCFVFFSIHMCLYSTICIEKN